MEVVICIVIYWVVAAMILLTPKVFEDVNRKLTVKEWLPTVLLAPLLMLLNSPKLRKAVEQTGPKKKTDVDKKTKTITDERSKSRGCMHTVPCKEEKTCEAGQTPALTKTNNEHA